jgi:hypothetical protein
MIMLLEVGERFSQRSFPEQDQMGQALLLTDRTQRSANAFKFGLCGGSRRHFTPAAAKVSRNSAQELGIAIVQHVATAVQLSDPLQCCIASHLTHPARLRMIGDASNGDPPALQVNEK